MKNSFAPFRAFTFVCFSSKFHVFICGFPFHFCHFPPKFLFSDVQNASASFVMFSFSCNKFVAGPVPVAQRRSWFASGLLMCIQFGSWAICTVWSGKESMCTNYSSHDHRYRNGCTTRINGIFSYSFNFFVLSLSLSSFDLGWLSTAIGSIKPFCTFDSYRFTLYQQFNYWKIRE